MPEKNKRTKTSKTAKRRWPKIVGISIGGVTGAIIIIFFLLPTIISTNLAKNRIINILESNLNRKIQIDDINMSWTEGFDIKNIFIGESEAFSGEKFVKVDRVLCNIEFVPLIKKQIKIKNFVIDRPEIVLQRDEDGHFNFEDLSELSKAGPSPSLPQIILGTQIAEAADNPEEKDFLPPFAIPYVRDIELNLKIINGRFTFIDHNLSEKTIIKDLNTTLNIESINKPIGFMTTFDIEAKGKTEHADISLNVSLIKDGEVDPRNARGIFKMKTSFAQIKADIDMARFTGKGGSGLEFLLNADLKEFAQKLTRIPVFPQGDADGRYYQFKDYG